MVFYLLLWLFWGFTLGFLVLLWIFGVLLWIFGVFNIFILVFNLFTLVFNLFTLVFKLSTLAQASLLFRFGLARLRSRRALVSLGFA